MQKNRQILTQQQGLKLSTGLLQSLKLMSLPYFDLREAIYQEAEKNPALEIVHDNFEKSLFTEYERGIKQSSYNGVERSNEHQKFIEGVLQQKETLQEHLLSQINEFSLSPSVHTLAQLIVQNIDLDGFLICPIQELPGSSDSSVVAEALSLVQGLDPVGCATEGIQESLKVQLHYLEKNAKEPLKELYDLTLFILNEHIEVLEKGRADYLRKMLSRKTENSITISLEQAESILDILRSLDPYPGRSFDTSPESWIVPDVIVKRTEDGFLATINGDDLPVLRISPLYQKLTQEEQSDKESIEFLEESIKDAQWFIQTLQRRNLSIVKVVEALIVFQRNFFMYGPTRLLPLRMKDIADQIQMHETTVSRAANGKYLYCDWGMFEIRYFFSTSLGGPLGGTSKSIHSSQSIKEQVKLILESSTEKLSDQKIVDLLAKKGISVARRTIAKYRTEMDFKSSYDRK